LEENNREAAGLDAVAVSKGPGSYTGLRIGVSTAKGIAYGSNIPLISVGTLDILVSGALQNEKVKNILAKNQSTLLCPMIDARRMEVYNALFNPAGKVIEDVTARIIDENSFEKYLRSGPVVFFGNGAMKCRDIINHPAAIFVQDIDAMAEYMIPLALESWQQKSFEDVAYFEPFYLKDFIATIPKNKIIPGNSPEEQV
jgi:tRNA threonylcarbamoyladenosine biosynthesis protein TsaB